MNGEMRMTNAEQGERVFDLEGRCARFGEAVIGFAMRIPVNHVTTPLVHRLVRAGTSVEANYCEADGSGSKRDFKFKIGLCRRETRETKHWLRMVVAAESRLREDARSLWQEAKELNLNFGAIRRKLGA